MSTGHHSEQAFCSGLLSKKNVPLYYAAVEAVTRNSRQPTGKNSGRSPQIRVQQIKMAARILPLNPSSASDVKSEWLLATKQHFLRLNELYCTFDDTPITEMF